MNTLRLTQSAGSTAKYRVEAAFENEDRQRDTAVSEFDLQITGQDREDLRWYLEDYLQHTADPAPKIAARIEKRITEIGIDLFKAVFQSTNDARDLWATLRD